MILEKVTLKNFLSHQSTEVTFRDGVTAFIGPNGAGKSAILDAISFALFKEHSRGKTLDALVRRGSGSAEVTLNFKVGNKHYIVSRRIVRGSKGVRCEAYLHCYNMGRIRLIARGERAVSEEIAKVLGIDRSTFINAIYVRQGEIDKLVTSQAHERKRVISKLLGLEDLEKAWKSIREIILDYEREKAKLEGVLNERDRVIVEIGEIKKELRTVEQKLKDEIKVLSNTEKLLKEYKEKLEHLEQRKRTYEKLTLNLKLTKQEIEDISLILEKKMEALKEITVAEERLKELRGIESRLMKLEEYYAIKREITSLNEKKEMLLKELNEVLEAIKVVEELSSCCEEYKKLSEKKERLKALIEKKLIINELIKEKKRRVEELSLKTENLLKKLKKQMKQILIKLNIKHVENIEELLNILKKMIDHYDKSIRDLNSELNELEREDGALNHALEELKVTIKQLEKSEGKCPLCKSELTERRRFELLKEYKSTYEDIEERLSKVRLIRKEVEKRLDEHRTLLNELRNIEVNNLLVLNNEVKQLGTQLADEKRSLNKLLQEYQKLEIEASQKKLDELNRVLTALERDYKRYIIAESVLKRLNKESLEKEVEFLDLKVRELELKLAVFKKQFGELSLKELEDRINDLRELKSEYDKLLGLVSYKEKLIKELEELKKKLDKKKEVATEIERQIKELEYHEREYEAFKNEIEVVEMRRSELISIISKLKEKQALLTARLQSLEKRLEEIKTVELELNKIVRFLNILERIRKLYSKDGLQRRIRAIARPLIESYTRSLFLMFGLDYDDLKINEDYEVTLIGTGGEQSIDSISGGEKTALALALRLSLARALTGSTLEFMMLDEPTVNMDESRRRELIRILKRISEGEGVIPQLIIVTHDHEIEEAADSVYLVKKEDGISKVYVQEGLD